MVHLKDRIILITGASSGIGREIAHEAVKKGAIAILCARDRNKLEAVRIECDRISAGKAFVFPLDISDVDQIDTTVDKIVDQFGKIDVLFNNAGFGITDDFVNISRGTIFKMFQVNVLGLMYLTQLVAIEMLKNEQGHIFNTASLAGKTATPQSSIYAATKSAVISFSNALRMELKPYNIKLTTINTGPVNTPFLETFGASEGYYEDMNSFLLEPKDVAEKAVKSIGKNKREINLPVALSIASTLYKIFPTIGDYFITHYYQK